MKSVALLMLLLVLIGCSRSDQSRLVGTWRAYVRGHEGTVTYREDGTFTQTVTSGVIQLETQGTYRLSKSSLSETTSEVLLTFKGQKLDGSNMRDLIGKTATTELKFLDDDTAQTTADGKTVKMVRVRRQLEK